MTTDKKDTSGGLFVSKAKSEHLISGVNVLDLTHYIAGPFCAKLLAGMGAEVIKVERPAEGDPSRRIGPFPGDLPHPEKSGAFLYLNTGKKSITLNLKTPTGVGIFKRLVRDADMLVENFEPRVMPSFGLSYDVLQNINPKLVMTSISNFGQSGCYRDYKADEMVVLALGGIMYHVGAQDREPLRAAYAASQYMGGLAGLTGTLAAFYHGARTGVGQQVDISLMECLVSSQGMVVYAYTGREARRGAQPSGMIQSVFPCKDGLVLLLVQPHHWPRLAQMLGMPELLEDHRFETAQARAMHAKELKTVIASWMLERTMEDIYHKGQTLGVPVGYRASSKELLSSPQYKARGFFVNISHPYAGELTYPGVPFKAEDISWQHSRAPLLGEHNQEIYCGRLGYSTEDLVRLRQMGVI